MSPTPTQSRARRARSLRRAAFGLVCAAAIATVACAPPRLRGTGIKQHLSAQPALRYASQCQQRVQFHASHVAAGSYLPADIRVRRWPAQAASQTAEGSVLPKEGELLPEAVFFAAVERRELRVALVEGRGGMGKSRMVDTLEARLCRELAVFRLDVADQLLPAVRAPEPGENPAFSAILRSLKAHYEPADRAGLKALMQTRPFVVLVDSLDDAPLAERAAVLGALQGLVEAPSGGAHAVVFGRGPLFDAGEALKAADAHVEILPLSCARAEERIEQELGDPLRSVGFWSAARRLGLERQRVVEGRCIRPHLATHRDAEVATAVYRALAGDGIEADIPVHRAALWEAWFRVLVERSSVPVPLPADALLGVVDAMVAATKPTTRTRNLIFEEAHCTAAVEAVGASSPGLVCSAFLMSDVFRRVPRAERWRLKDRTLQDWFLARWASGQLVADGCGGTTALVELIEAREVAGFLVGLPGGQACFAELLDGACARGLRPADALALLDQGLPTGEARAAILGPARGKLRESCAITTVDRL